MRWILVSITAAAISMQAAGADRRQHQCGCMMGASYDKAAEASLKGTVEKVVTHSHGKMKGMHLMLKAESANVEVHLGPAWFLNQEKFSVKEGDRIEVLGTRTKMDGKEALIARTVTKGDVTWTLREEDGTPKWAGGHGGGKMHRHRE